MITEKIVEIIVLKNGIRVELGKGKMMRSNLVCRGRGMEVGSEGLVSEIRGRGVRIE